jgi:acetyl-CoA acetyltransferase
LAPDNVVTVAEQMGLQLRWAHQGAHGGASGVVSLMQAAEAITAGRASAVVCAAADAFDVSSHMAMLDSFNAGMRDYLAPYCFGGTNGIFALVQNEHCARYGPSREQLGKLAVTQRRHAQHNPTALLTADMSLDDYLGARLIADPIRLYDCVMPCAGGDAIMLVSKEIAKRLRRESVRVLAGEQMHNYAPCEALSLTTGAAAFAERLFESASVLRKDLSFIQLYDDYPIMELIQLEDLGFARKGSGGHFIDEHDLSVNGDLPLNTGGGQLSCGQAGASGGMIGLFEAVTQLNHAAGARQVRGAHLGLVSGFGMVGYGRGLSSAAVVLAREDSLS